MSRYHTTSRTLRAGDALPALGNPRTEAFVEGWPIGRQRCRAWFAVESGPRGERASRRTENKARTGWNAPKYTTYAARVRIADGDDGRTYIVRDVGSHINVMRGDMEHDAGNVFPRDPRHADILSLFGPPTGGPAAVTACRHGQFLTEETCATCLAEGQPPRPRRRPRPAAPPEEEGWWLWPEDGEPERAGEPEHAGMDEIDLEAERLGRGMGPARSYVHQRRRIPQERKRAEHLEEGIVMDRRIAGIAARIAGRRTGVNVNEGRWIGRHSDPGEPVAHLSLPRGGTACGAAGEAEADINHVTCPECLRLHDMRSDFKPPQLDPKDMAAQWPDLWPTEEDAARDIRKRRDWDDFSAPR